MKKTVLFIIILFNLGLFISCEPNESLNPGSVLVEGQFMRLDIVRDRLKASDPLTSFGGELTNPSKNVVKFELFVQLTRGGVVLNNYIPYEVVTSFPVDYAITPSKIEQAFTNAGVDVGPIRVGDFYRFIGISYDKNGNTARYQNLSRTIQGEPAYKQAYRFNLSYTNVLTGTANNYIP